ncbi:porin [Rhodoligotrophos defluvii]|uniref:porin n=1 Tax=Rhodoligotrophos defluvii TaxID=2561934 RepID=UPI0010C9D559|nr:porin [Rhodoligotrophos defluvii]
MPNWLLKRNASTIPSARYFGLTPSQQERTGTTMVKPAADLPADEHVAEIILSGYVKGDVIYDTRHDLGDIFQFEKLFADDYRLKHTRVHARQSRLRVQARSDTDIGYFRAMIEGDFFGGTSSDPALRLRHAWGEWEPVNGAIFGAGQYWRNFVPPVSGFITVDENGPAGLASKPFAPQVRLTHRSGPLEFAISAENSSVNLIADRVPDLAGRVEYKVPGGSAFYVSGLGRYFSSPADMPEKDHALGWGVHAGASLNLGDLAVLSAAVTYGTGLGSYLMGGTAAAWFEDTGKAHVLPAWGFFAGARVYLSDTTSINVGAGYAKPKASALQRAVDYNLGGDDPADGTFTSETKSLHANFIWEPIEQIRLGWEVMWAQRKYWAAGDPLIDPPPPPRHLKASDLRGQFGAWFFF